MPLVLLSQLHQQRGDFATAWALLEEASELGEEALGGFVQIIVLTTVAFTAAHLDRDDDCVTNAHATLAIAKRLGDVYGEMSAQRSLGMLELFRGDPAAAIEYLERAHDLQARYGAFDPGFVYVEANLTEAYIRAGCLDEARSLLGELRAGAQRTGGAWATAATARYAALLDSDDDIDGYLDVAMAALQRVDLAFETARTKLIFGERLRRARRRREAQVLLREATTAFRAFGAIRWAQRAEDEYVAAGGRLLHTPAAPLSRTSATRQARELDLSTLTAQEHKVAELVARGASNPEVAAALFLSRRTVEHHLRQVYFKLGLRSRTELAAQFVTPDRHPRGIQLSQA
jgi:DNA-binding CsgD family transcriptional regulator